MEISRILRVLITVILVVTFIVITVAAYRQNQEVNAMITLSDATSSIVTGLASRELAWVDGEGNRHPYILNSEKLKGLDFNRLMAGENFAFRASITYPGGSSEEVMGPCGKNVPEGRTTGSISVAVALRREGEVMPAKLEVVVWYA